MIKIKKKKFSPALFVSLNQITETKIIIKYRFGKDLGEKRL